MTIGGEKEFKLKLPEDYSTAELAGKEAQFKVKVKEIKQQNLPKLGSEFAKLVSAEFKTMAALRKGVTENLRLRAEQRTKEEFEEIYKKGIETTGKVVRTIEKGLIVRLPENVEGFVPYSQLAKVEGKGKGKEKSFEPGEEYPLRVIEFDKEQKKIVLSYDILVTEKERKEVDDFVKTQGELQKETIGDRLKEQENESVKKSEKKEPKKQKEKKIEEDKETDEKPEQKNESEENV
jgi:hypothetical protein